MDWGTEYPTSSVPNVVNTQVAYTQLQFESCVVVYRRPDALNTQVANTHLITMLLYENAFHDAS